jgi:hypothetical protein
MNRRKFMKQSLVVGVAASGALRLDAGKAFAEDAPTGGGRSATLAAKPTPISLDLAKTVVMVVDMQNDFGSKGGMFDRAGFDTASDDEVIGIADEINTRLSSSRL